MTLFAVPFIVLAVLAGMFLSFAPYTSDAAKKWFQLKFMCPYPGDIGLVVKASGPEAILQHIAKIHSRSPDVPVNSIVLVVSYVNKDEAVCTWNNNIVVLRRRWIRKVK